MKVMNHLNNKNVENLNRNVSTMMQEISLMDCKTINGGDNITQAVFGYLGAVWAGIKQGQPHAAYGRYAGMYSK